jgi:CheY-like chemotaxis protein/signal transduction histidine kinase/HPt (histidine-containing phosphotransfer) domain-containing protein
VVVVQQQDSNKMVIRRLVLVIDSVSTRREQIAELLSTEGHEVIAAGNGLQALNSAARKQVDLIILDSDLPDLPGLAVVKTLQEFKEKTLPPLIVLTENKTQLLHDCDPHLSFAEVLNKSSFDPESLRAIIRKILASSSRLEEANLAVVAANQTFASFLSRVFHGSLIKIEQFSDTTEFSEADPSKRFDVAMLCLKKRGQKKSLSWLSDFQDLHGETSFPWILILDSPLSPSDVRKISGKNVLCVQAPCGVEEIRSITEVLISLKKAKRNQLPTRNNNCSNNVLSAKTDSLLLQTNNPEQAVVQFANNLRRPLTAIMGYAEGLQDPKLSRDSLTNGLRDIANNGSYVLQLIDDLNDITAVQAGTFSVSVQEIVLARLIEEIESETRERTKNQDVHFAVSYLTKLPEKIATDGHCLKRLIRGLLDNALKFTSDGHITLGMSFNPTENLLTFAVSDTGIGMPPDKVTQLRTLLESALDTQQMANRTSCLGLSFIKHAAKKLGGDLRLESADGMGSTFTLSIGVGTKEQQVQMSAPVIKVKKLTRMTSFNPEELHGTVLIAEDNFETQRVFTFMLKNTNIRFIFADNGQIAVDKVSNDKFDLILMDLMMPVMGGIEAMKKIRALGCKTPIIAVTAAATATAKQESFDAGCNAYLEKPVSLKQLYRTLAEHLPIVSKPAPNKADASQAKKTSVPERLNGKQTSSHTHPPRPARVSAPSTLREHHPEMQDVINGFVSQLNQKMNNLSLAIANRTWRVVGQVANELAGTAAMCGFRDLSKILLKLEVISGSEDIEEISAVFESAMEQAKMIAPDIESSNNSQTTSTKMSNPSDERVIRSEFVDSCEELVPIILDFLDTVDRRVSDLEQLANENQWEELGSSSHEVSGTAALCGYSDFSSCARQLELISKQADNEKTQTLLNELRDVAQAMLRGKKELESVQ